MIPRALVCKLEQFQKLSETDKQLLGDLIDKVTTFKRREDIVRQEEQPDAVHLLLSGWACRYKILPGGERHITAFLIPGDLCDIHVGLIGHMDHSIGTLTCCTVGAIPIRRIMEICQDHPRLSSALSWCTLVDEAILREWLVMLGRHQADKRTAHLLCEMMLRTEAVGLADGARFELPLTQEELGDTLGLSAVHVCRTLQHLRQRGMISTCGKMITIEDIERLMEFADFDGAYLHQDDRSHDRSVTAVA